MLKTVTKAAVDDCFSEIVDCGLSFDTVRGIKMTAGVHALSIERNEGYNKIA